MSRKPPQELILTIGGQRITAERFVKAVSAFVGLINDVADAVTEERGAFHWVVSVESGSAVVHFRPEPARAPATQAPAAIKAVNEGFALLEKRPERPRFWSDSALRKAKDLAEVIEAGDDALDRVTVAVDHRGRDVTRNTSANVDALFGSDYNSLGTIEGRLRAVTEAGGLHFVVQDPVTRSNVRCYFKEDEAERYVAAWRKRVAVYGEIRYRKDGEPVSIAVQEFRVLREAHELPKARDVKGILAA
jgi:hypothetical protein